MSKPIQTVEELDAVLHWRGKHAQAIRERDALQKLLNQREPMAWTEVDVLDFMSVALRHADYSGLSPSDILDVLRCMAEKGKPAFVRAEQPAPAAVVPELTSELRWILGQMCFQHIHTAHALRVMGHQIARKAEDEQAVTIYWMLGHYLKDPENWRENATAEMKAAAPAA